VYLVRHGRTPLNAAGVLRGWSHVPLDHVGRAEARAVGGHLRGLGIRRVVASPLRRASETGAKIAEAVGVTLELDNDLADRHYGQWAGRRLDEVENEFGSIDEAPGVEPAAEFVARVVAAFVRASRKVSPVVVVGHDVVNRHVLAALVPRIGNADGIPQRTGCWNRLERHPEGWSAPIIDALPGESGCPRT
jgi:broad specificity phosphatase PhoE